ncbi:ABC transporter ATP-binding protein [Agrococcus sp. SL85]|uniref:ABC transporter ATP-binding protein n=1 Tax=Agrococcus sp. SL85 TaxID=2995141 RepID=UPI002D1E3D36|nr:ABC transporter ATP-binding protein [Agrococcus sp. SL85]
MQTFQPSANRLDAVALAHAYGDPATHARVLDGVSLTIGADGPEAVAIMGPSGSGKSTLLHVLAGIVGPQGGRVAWRGRELASMRDAERTRLRRSDFGFVFQSGQLLPELPAVENVALPLLLAGQARGRAEAHAAELLGRLGLAGLESRRPGELSGGQAQRVAIARALVGSPGIVFADEPTGALDRSTGTAVMSLLIGATLGHGASLVVVTHDPEVAAACSRIVRLQDGRVVGDERTDAAAAAAEEHGGFVHAGAGHGAPTHSTPTHSTPTAVAPVPAAAPAPSPAPSYGATRAGVPLPGVPAAQPTVPQDWRGTGGPVPNPAARLQHPQRHQGGAR